MIIGSLEVQATLVLAAFRLLILLQRDTLVKLDEEKLKVSLLFRFRKYFTRFPRLTAVALSSPVGWVEWRSLRRYIHLLVSRPCECYFI